MARAAFGRALAEIYEMSLLSASILGVAILALIAGGVAWLRHKMN
jgi:hypothetical protein